MNSPRKITRQLDYGYINEIIELSKNINLYSVSLLVDYSNLFNEEEKSNINKYTDKIEEYIRLLNGFKQLLIKDKCHSSIHRKFKIITQEIFEIEQLLKKYSIKVWKNELTDIKNFKNGGNYCFAVHSLLMDPSLIYEQDEQVVQQQYEKRLAMLQDKRRRYLSTSLVANELTCLFYESHIAAIIKVDESNYIGACSQDAGTGDSMFTTTCAFKGNFDDIYTLKRDESGNFFTAQPATIVSTPKVIKYKQLYDDRTVTISEIILDRMKSETQGILCYVYGNEFLSYSRRFAERLGIKYNLPVVYIDKMLYTDKKIGEYELYERYEIAKGIMQYLEDETREKIHHLSECKFDIELATYLNLFKIANTQMIKSNEEAKYIVEKLARQIIRQKELGIER